MTAAPRVVVVAPGTARHGVVAHARRAARAVGARFIALPAGPTAAIIAPRVIDQAATDVLHMHYTDQLFGRSCEEGPPVAGQLVRALARPTVITLHDVPGDDGDVRDARRIAAYRRVAALADRVVVASAGERDRLARIGVDRPVDVVSLAWESLARLPIAPHTTPVIGILGFIFPGKGHVDVVHAAAALRRRVAVWAIGTVSDGHDELIRTLFELSARLDVPFHVSGFLSEPQLAATLAAVDVPVTSVHHGSASASLLTWIGAWRRPLARYSAFTSEIASLAPGSVHLYDGDEPDQLVSAIRLALADPASTRATARPAALAPASVAAQTRSVYGRVAGGTE